MLKSQYNSTLGEKKSEQRKDKDVRETGLRSCDMKNPLTKFDDNTDYFVCLFFQMSAV